MARKTIRRTELQPGETGVKGAADATGYSVSTLYTYFEKLPEHERPPFIRRRGMLVGKLVELEAWAARREVRESSSGAVE